MIDIDNFFWGFFIGMAGVIILIIIAAVPVEKTFHDCMVTKLKKRPDSAYQHVYAQCAAKHEIEKVDERE